jgi:hypothetical protein
LAYNKRTIIHHPSFLKGNIPERKISRKEHILKIIPAKRMKKGFRILVPNSLDNKRQEFNNKPELHYGYQLKLVAIFHLKKVIGT